MENINNKTHPFPSLSSPTEDLPRFYRPDPVSQDRVKNKIGGDSNDDPWCTRGVPSQHPVNIECGARDSDSRVTQY